MEEIKNLTTSKVERQNILNNSLAVTEIQKHTTIMILEHLCKGLLKILLVS